jgi:iron complex transport system substrate-binding protein
LADVNKRRLTIYLIGVLLGCVLLLFIPRSERKERRGNPWAEQTAPWGYYPRDFTDDTGRTVHLERQPRIVVSLAPGISDMMVALGMGDHLLGVTKWCDNPALEGVTRIGGLDAPDLERIAALQASLVVGTEMTPAAIYDRLAELGIPAIAFRHEDFEDVVHDMGRLSIVLGVPRLGVEAAQALRARREAVLAQVPTGGPRPTVALLYDFDTFGSAGSGTWVGDLLDALHLDNIAAGAASPWPALSREALIARDPDWIIVPRPADAAAARELDERLASLPRDAVLGHLKAVRGPRSIRALEEIARGVYGVEVADSAASSPR